jgi:hypothetical protein
MMTEFRYPRIKIRLLPHCNSGFRFCSINGHAIKSSDRSADRRARRTRMTIGIHNSYSRANNGVGSTAPW